MIAMKKKKNENQIQFRWIFSEESTIVVWYNSIC